MGTGIMKSDTENNLVSVILSVFNSAQYLKDAIESILNQTYTNFEFIIIDDGSVDNTESIIRTYSDPRIIFIKNEKNKGLIYSLNLGISIAKGAYIARMDADDLSLPERFDEQVDYLKNSPHTVVVGTHQAEVRNNKIITRGSGEYDSDFLKGILLFNTCFSHPTVMMRNIFQKNGLYYDSKFIHAEDFRIWTELALKGDFHILNKVLLKYRLHPEQISNKHAIEQDIISSEIRRDHLQNLGFKFNEKQLSIHNCIGNHKFITSWELLLQIEEWLISLIEQNQYLKLYSKEGFNQSILKNWMDTCGNSNFGWKAFWLCIHSPIALREKISLMQKGRLLAKCLIRSKK
jgi:glycosyltransferase involved in cell wall biosynthesis